MAERNYHGAWTKDRLPRVLVTQLVPEAGLEILRSFAQVDVDPDPDRILSDEELRAKLPEYDGLYCLLTNRIDGPLLDANPNLWIVANMAVGYNNIDVDAATARGIPVSNTPGVLTDTTADFAWTLLLAAARRVVEGDKLSRAGKFHGWGPLMLIGHDIAGKTLGVVGFGRIGRAVAKRATGFDMQVLYHDVQRADATTEQALNARQVELDELLRESDFVSLHVNYTPETHHLIAAAQLATMKPTAILVNTSRGPVVDEAALAEALRNGTIAGAGLDVYEEEPRIHPGLLAVENAVLAPHIASATLDTRNAMAVAAAENVRAIFLGQRPPNLINPAVWED